MKQKGRGGGGRERKEREERAKMRSMRWLEEGKIPRGIKGQC